MKERSLLPPVEPRTYYDRPILKEPVWKWPIPAYFFAGGLSAGSSLLAVAAGVRGDHRPARRARLSALAAIAASAGLLIADLGKPSRFHHMLRVAKPTSPMSVGSWLLTAYGPATGLAALSDVTGRVAVAGTAAGAVSAALAPAIASYTAVLVSDTAVPAWHDAQREMPFVFAGSAAASAGALGVILAGGRQAGTARRMAVLGALLEAVAGQVMERRLAPEVASAYHEGATGRLERVARGLTAAGAGALVLGRRRRVADLAGAAAVFAGALVQRFAIFEAGRSSARDPLASSVPQRRHMEDVSDHGPAGSPRSDRTPIPEAAARAATPGGRGDQD